jgi:hypothetical protein
MIENAGMGSRFGAPSVRAIYGMHLLRQDATREETPPNNIALRIRWEQRTGSLLSADCLLLTDLIIYGCRTKTSKAA